MSYNNEMYHWGIKGQKWGVRRFQNEDGTLTALGKERYGDIQIEKSRTEQELYRNSKKSDRNTRKAYWDRLDKADRETDERLNNDPEYTKLLRESRKARNEYDLWSGTGFEEGLEKKYKDASSDVYDYEQKAYAKGRQAVKDSLTDVEKLQIRRANIRTGANIAGAALAVIAGISLYKYSESKKLDRMTRNSFNKYRGQSFNRR